MRIRLLAAAAALALGACTADQDLLGMLSGSSGPVAGSRYVPMAAAGDLFEMQASHLALTQAQDPEVRDLARMLVKDHSQATQTLAAAALESGLSAPAPALTASQQRMLAALQRAPAGSFDELYLRQQLPAHQAALRLHHAYALSGDAEPLRYVAASAVSKVYQHLQEVRRIRRALST